MSEATQKPKIILDNLTIFGIIAIVIIIIGVATFIVANPAHNNTASSTQATASDTPTSVSSNTENVTSPISTPTVTVPIAKTSFSDGTYEVGKDIQPGTYKTEGEQGYSCVWKRLSGFGGSDNEVIEENSVNGQTLVTIESTDKGFESQYCGTWVKE